MWEDIASGLEFVVSFHAGLGPGGNEMQHSTNLSTRPAPVPPPAILGVDAPRDRMTPGDGDARDLARAVARVLGMSAGLVDAGAVLAIAPSADLSASHLAAVWRAPQDRSAPASFRTEGEGPPVRVVAIPLTLGDREAWAVGFDMKRAADMETVRGVEDLVAALARTSDADAVPSPCARSRLADCTVEGLPAVATRAGAEARIDAVLAAAGHAGRRAQLLLADIDDFRAVNDYHGREAGDAVLASVSRVLQDLVPPHGTILRLAADEFVAIVPCDEADDQLPGRICDALARPVRFGGDMLSICASVGTALFPRDAQTGADLCGAADLALQEAKKAGHGLARPFIAQMRDERRAHLALVAAVRDGLAANQFVPYFQPKLDLKTGEVVGFEALCRWHHPERGMLEPCAFFRAFDDPLVGGALSDVALHGGFRAMHGFRRQGLPVDHVSVNLNRLQLERPGLVGEVAALQAEFAIPPGGIVFEMLENVLIEAKASSTRTLRTPPRRFPISLDDFGTGFASLTHMRESFIHEVKIDRAFVVHAWTQCMIGRSSARSCRCRARSVSLSSPKGSKTSPR